MTYRWIKNGLQYGNAEILCIEELEDFSIIQINTKRFKAEDGLKIGVHDNGDIEIKLGDGSWEYVRKFEKELNQ